MTTDTPEGLAALEWLAAESTCAELLNEPSEWVGLTPESRIEYIGKRKDARDAAILAARAALKPEAVAEAVAAERERCAKIALDLYDPRKNNGAREWDEWAYASAQVATAIRTGADHGG